MIGLEACSGNHFLAKEFNKQGHDARLMAGQRVKPYVTSGNKNDKVDAEAICEAVGRPNMIFVPIKSTEQLDIQALHRHCKQLSKRVNQLSNQMRGFLIENGIVIPKGISHTIKNIPLILEDAENTLSHVMRELIHCIYRQLLDARQALASIQLQIKQCCESHPLVKKLCAIPGIGPMTATALYAAIGNGRQFKNGREAAAWLGLIPRHVGSGGKTYTKKLSKRGNRYLKTLAIQGGRSLVLVSRKKDDPRSKIIQEYENRKGHNLAAVASAHHNIKIAWALLAKGQVYKQVA